MLKEIYEQPRAIADTLKEAFTQARDIVRLLNVQSLAMVYFTGSGTSYHACLAANYATSTLTRVFSTSLPASEFASWVGPAGRENTILIAISQSGESTDVLAAVKAASNSGIRTIGITNSPGSSLVSSTDFSLASLGGEEKAVTATKSFTATLAATYALVIELGQVFPSETFRHERLSEALRKTPSQVERTIQLCDKPVRDLAAKFAEREFYFILGSGPNYATALEGALKMKESCNVHAEGFATREFLHGPMQLVEARTPVFILQGSDEVEQVRSLEESFHRFGASTVVIKRENAHGLHAGLGEIGVAADVAEVFSPLAYVVPMQMYAYYFAVQRRLNPDHPEKLTKVVK
jgi:glucosamine--fructose-6-phosphate aminotransferase (isomerizing)